MGAASGAQPPAGAAQILSTGSVLGRRVYREDLVEPRHADVYPARGVTRRAAAELGSTSWATSWVLFAVAVA